MSEVRFKLPRGEVRKENAKKRVHFYQKWGARRVVDDDEKVDCKGH